jgi:hypothetical protein
MENSEQQGSGGRADWPVRLAGAVGGLIAGALGLLVKSLVEPPWQWGLGAFAFVGMIVVGIILGQFVGSRLFRKPPGK